MEPINGRIVRAAGAVLRQLGQAVDRFGLSMQGKEGYVERCECAHENSGFSVLRSSCRRATKRCGA
jgi:hypothetical protein